VAPPYSNSSKSLPTKFPAGFLQNGIELALFICEVFIAIKSGSSSSLLIGGVAFPIERGSWDVYREPSRLSPISNMSQSERTCRRCRRKKYAGRRNVPQSRLLAGSRIDLKTKRD
jgi:hypothetical protein